MTKIEELEYELEVRRAYHIDHTNVEFYVDVGAGYIFNNSL